MKPGASSDALRFLWLWLTLLAASAGLLASSRAEGTTAAERLQRMANALQTLSYEGTLVYLHENHLDALHLAHRIEGGRFQERLVSLNGPERALTRDEDQVACVLSDTHPILVKRPGVAQDLLGTRSIDPAALADHYLIHPLGSARVAGRETDVVGIIPRDSLRYGYRFYLDRASGLPLKSDLIGQQVEPIEQIMFTSLELLPASASTTAARPAGHVAAQGTSGKPAAVARPKAPPDVTTPWYFEGLPAGFELVMQDRWTDADGDDVRQFLLSDRLASVSVYIEDEASEGLEGTSRIGAVNAVGARVAGHQITVVGEVPAETVAAVLASLRYDQGRSR